MTHKKLVIFMPSIEGGGVEKNFFIISNYLSTKKLDVSIITAEKKFDHLFNKKIKVISPKSNFWSYQKRYPKYLVCIFFLIKEHLQFKKFLTLSFQANIYCIIISKIFNKKVVSRSNSSAAGWSKNYLKNLLFKKILKIADKIIVNSEDFKKELDKKFNINSTCIYNPFNKSTVIKLSKKKLKNLIYKNDKTLKIINIGRLVDQKDQMTLLKAIKLIKEKISIKAVIMGRGIEKKNLDRYICNNKLKKIVQIIGFKNNPYNYIKKSELFILTSIYEGLPNVLLEAQCLKKFIISTNCPTGPREILLDGKAGFLFPLKNEQLLAKKILDYHKRKKKLNKMIVLGYNKLNRFDADINLKKYYNLINQYL